MQCFLSSLRLMHTLCTLIVTGSEGTTCPQFCLSEKRGAIEQSDGCCSENTEIIL